MRHRSPQPVSPAPLDTTVETAVDWAEVAAMLGDYREAVSWLVYVEWLQGSLPPELAKLRARWEFAAQTASGLTGTDD